MDHPAVFQVLIKTITRISTDTAGQKALKSVNLPSLKVKRPKRAYHRTTKSRNCTDVCTVGWPEQGGGNLTCCPPKIETFETFPEFAKLPYICVSFQQIIFKLGNFTDFKAFFPALLRIFSDRVSHEKTIHTTKE